MQTQPEPSKAGHEQFIVWFKAQNFYTNLAFAHGDRLFDFEQSENTFRVLAVQTAWCVWQELTASMRIYARLVKQAETANCDFPWGRL